MTYPYDAQGCSASTTTTSRAARSYSYSSPLRPAPTTTTTYPSPRSTQPLYDSRLRTHEYDFLAFGGTYSPTTTVSLPQRYTYTGREVNPASDLMYYRYRQYDPRVGRFGARDPIGYDRSGGSYGYAAHHPIIKVDHHGLVAREWDWKTRENTRADDNKLTRPRRIVWTAEVCCPESDIDVFQLANIECRKWWQSSPIGEDDGTPFVSTYTHEEDIVASAGGTVASPGSGWVDNPNDWHWDTTYMSERKGSSLSYPNWNTTPLGNGWVEVEITDSPGDNHYKLGKKGRLSNGKTVYLAGERWLSEFKLYVACKTSATSGRIEARSHWTYDYFFFLGRVVEAPHYGVISKWP